MSTRRFAQVDVFTDRALLGNALAVARWLRSLVDVDGEQLVDPPSRARQSPD